MRSHEFPLRAPRGLSDFDTMSPLFAPLGGHQWAQVPKLNNSKCLTPKSQEYYGWSKLGKNIKKRIYEFLHVLGPLVGPQ